MAVEALRAWLRARLGEYTQVPADTIRLGTRFRDQGLHSVQILQLVQALGEHVGRAIPASAAWEYPTPEELAQYVLGLAQLPESISTKPSSPQAARDDARDAAAAVIGIACRFPGGVTCADELWKLLRDGRSGIREVPKQRFDIDAFFDADVSAPGKMSTRHAGLIDDVDAFDAAFFGISAREARQMDPQQRIVLELAWQAFEDAGIDPTTLKGASVGVFIGAMWSDYARLLHRDIQNIDAHTATGQDTSIISGRVSYVLGLSGISLTVNTACSSSAMAVHLALQSLRSGEVQLALAGGVHLMSSPESTVALTKFGAMNPAGQCRAFDAGANGYVRGEGAGLVLLKPHARAVADGDDIYCLIRGSAANNDGFSNGLTAPNPRAQEAVIRQALANANVDAASITYVETHGPGTILGDPLEAGALGAVFAPTRSSDEPLRIGSVKTNLGHLEAAAASAGLIKVALSLRHRVLLPSLNFEHPNPHIPFDRLRLQVQTECESWPESKVVPRAGLSSFGFGGTNCHLVLEAAPKRASVIVPLAADSGPLLRARALAAIGVLSRGCGVREMEALGGQIAERCVTGTYRTAVVSAEPSDLIRKLTNTVAAASHNAKARAVVGARARLVYVCPGQGAHWLGMMRSTFAWEPTFRRALAECDRAVQAQYGWSVIDELLASEAASGLERPEVAQLVQLSVQLSLAALWTAWGCPPDAIVGHSLGEIAACCIAGILSLPDAVRIVGERARMMNAPEAQGGMLSVTLQHAGQLAQAIELAAPLELAAHNSPLSIVFSGSAERIERARVQLEAAGIRANPVRNVPLAGHSSHMEGIRAPLRDALVGLQPSAARLRMRSTVVESWLEGPECGGSYWADNVRRPVQFRQAIEAISGEGPTIFLELGAHPVLLKAIAQTTQGGAYEHITLATSYRGEDERRCMLETLAELFQRGFDPCWSVLSRADEPISEEAQRELSQQFGSTPTAVAGAIVPLVVSAKHPESLTQQLSSLHAHLSARPALALRDVAAALAQTRGTFSTRAVVLARDRDAALAALLLLAEGNVSTSAVRGEADEIPRLACLFTGQGSQRARMGQALARAVPAFRAALTMVLDAFEAETNCRLREVMFAAPDSPNAARLHDTEYAQPALFALEVALYRCLESWNVRPRWLLGHSIGELAAAHVAGVMSLRHACVLVAARGRLMQGLPSGGAMLSVRATEAEMSSWLARYDGVLSLAAINGPESVVVSGARAAVEQLERELGPLARETSRLRVSHAFHSALMEPMLDAFGEVIAKLELRPAQLPIISSVTGELAPPELFATPEYWLRQAREPVRFHDALCALHAAGARHYVELGARAVLTPLVRALHGDHDDVAAWPTMQPERDEEETFLHAAAQLHVHGHDIAWSAAHAAHSGGHVRLPGYAFRRERFWVDVAPQLGETATPALYQLRWSSPDTPAPKPIAYSVIGPDWLLIGATSRYPTLAALCDALAAGAAAPPVIVLGCVAELSQTAQLATERALNDLQCILADERFAATRCCFLTRRAVAAGEHEDVLDLPHAPIWGLVRSAQREHPDRKLGLLDIEGNETPEQVAAALGCDAAELALRNGELRVPRLIAAEASPRTTQPTDFSDGTVLITGGVGALGQLVARHLAQRYAARDIVLCSRSVSPELAQSLSQALSAATCARVEVVACDVAEPTQLRALLAAIPRDRPLVAVFHAAGVVDDGVIAAQNAERIARVFRPKLVGAQQLHELTRELPLRAFVLFSSTVGLFGHGGQSNYGAANAFLDALAHHRRALGLPATSIAWGYWARPSKLTAQLAAVDRKRFEREGVRPLADAAGLLLLDLALQSPAPQLVAAQLDLVRIAREPDASALFDRLITRAATPHTDVGTLATQLSACEASEREALVLAAVYAVVAAVMGTSGVTLAPTRPLKDAGLDSLMAIELRNRLARVSGLRLPATLLFDHPSPAALARTLLSQLQPHTAAIGGETGAPVVPRASLANEPIAIVAMSCRAPGGVESPEALWELLRGERDVIEAFPRDRGWALDDLFATDPDAIGKSYARTGGFLRDVPGFEPEFFDITPREALAMDPQQRLLLETSWEAFERAGIDPKTLEGSATGVFVGLNYHDYQTHTKAQPNELEGYVATGSAGSVAAGRIAYHYGLHGPAMCVDTACSSSLVALHLACQSLRRGECALALAGGATVMSTPDAFVEFSRQRGLSPDGRCKAFSAAADGVGWGEGIGWLLLEPLSVAQQNQHPVLALIRGSAVNHDGRSQGLTAPSGLAQQRVIRAALIDAGIASTAVDTVEAHGTGTRLGDPIEAQSLIAAYGAERTSDNPLWIGSIKSNIGHAQSAAGVLGAIKLVLALEHELLPATLHAAERTPHVDWTAETLQLLAAARPWSRNERPRIAGVSAFGIGGTNAHILIEEPPLRALPAASRDHTGPLPVVISARSEAALRAAASRLQDFVREPAAPRVCDVAYSLATGRTTHAVRAAIVACDREELALRLDDLVAGREHPRVLRGDDAKLVLMFSGQGSQRAGAGRALYEQSPQFRSELDRVLAGFGSLDGGALRELMFASPDSPEATRLDRTEYAQPALFALEVALYRVLAAYGVVPQLLIGHSVGEIAAAHVASVLSLEHACELVAARGKLMQALPEGGAMYALDATEQEVLVELTGTPGVVIAAINGELNVVVSGVAAQAAALAQRFAARGRQVRRLNVSHAFHSPQMEPMLEAFEAVVARLELVPPRIPIISSLTGERVEPQTLCSAQYWLRQLREPVRFHAALQRSRALGGNTYLELGPGSTLAGLVESTGSPTVRAYPVLPTRAGTDDALSSLMRALAVAHVGGAKLAFDTLFAPLGAVRCVLPTYAFQRRRFWPDAKLPVAKPRAPSALDDKRYRIAWERVSPAVSSAAGAWLVLSSSHDEALAQSLAAALSDAGARVSSAPLADGELAFGAELPDRVVLFATDATLEPDDVTPRAALHVLAGMRACSRADRSAALWIITRGAVQTDAHDAPPSPEQALVCGLGRVLSLEHPEAWGGQLDLDAKQPPSLDQLVLALTGAGAEDELALRAHDVLARRMDRADWDASDRRVAAYSGTALITGGTGALGRRVARFLAARGTTHLVLTSRSGDAGTDGLRAELEGLGVRVTIRALDVADREALARLLAAISDSGETLDTVVHAAGVNAVAPCAELGREQLTATLRAKVLGARHLDALLQDRPPKHFVLFASGAGVWGSAGQGAYAAANAYLDALAQRRAAHGRAATSIAWGIWAGGGMANGSIESLRRRGVLPLEPDTALLALDGALAQGVDNITVADFDWEIFAGIYSAARERPLIARLVPRRADAPDAASAQHAFLARLRGTVSAGRERLVLQAVCDAMAAVLGVEPRRVQPQAALKELGMDSLMAVQLRNRLSELTGQRLPATLLFNYPSPAALAAYLSRRLTPEAPDLTSAPSLVRELERLSLGDLDAATTRALVTQLEALVIKWTPSRQRDQSADAHLFDDTDDEQLLRLVDESIAQQGLE